MPDIRAKTERNLEIVKLFLDGTPQNEIARAYTISCKRVGQILNVYFNKNKIPPHVDRAKAVDRLERQILQLLAEVDKGNLKACRELRQAIMTQARIAGTLAPLAIDVRAVKPLFSEKDFADQQEQADHPEHSQVCQPEQLEASPPPRLHLPGLNGLSQ